MYFRYMVSQPKPEPPADQTPTPAPDPEEAEEPDAAPCATCIYRAKTAPNSICDKCNGPVWAMFKVADPPAQTQTAPTPDELDGDLAPRPPPLQTPLSKEQLKELLGIIDRSLDDSVRFRNDIAKLLGVEARDGPVSPVAPAPDVPLEPISTDSMMERAEHHRQADREEINRGKVPIAKNILETYGPRWAWKPSELSIQSAIKQVLAGKRQAAAPAPVGGASPASLAQTQGMKPATAQDAILKVLSGGGHIAYKPLSEKVQSLGFTAEQFSDAYSNLTAMNLVVEESLDQIRKA